MTDTLAVTDLTVRRDGTRALDGVTVGFEPGAVHVLAGPNGSGKTTLLRVLAGLIEPTAGTVARPAAVSCAFQRPSLYPSLSVGENLEVFARLVDAEASWRATLVERLALDGLLDRPAAALSDGQAAALDLALALLKQPPVVLFDEPLADLDARRSRRLLAVLDAYRGPERTVVVSTHDVDAVAGLCDRLVVLFEGAVALDEPAATLAGDPAAAYEAALDARLSRG